MDLVIFQPQLGVDLLQGVFGNLHMGLGPGEEDEAARREGAGRIDDQQAGRG
jgi:hypothetical protein